MLLDALGHPSCRLTHLDVSGNGLSAVVMDGSDDANALYEASIKAKEVLKSFPAVPLLLSGCASAGIEVAGDKRTDLVRLFLSISKDFVCSALVPKQVHGSVHLLFHSRRVICCTRSTKG